MNTYFSATINTNPFQMFSVSHVLALCVFAALNIALVFWFAKKKAGKPVDRFRYFLAVFLLANEILSVLWSAAAGVFTLDYALPIQLCDAAAFLSAAMLLWGYQLPFELVYFWGLGGSLQALITPDLYYPFPHFVFFNFFFTHGAIVTAVFYMIAAKGCKPTLRSVGKTVLCTNLYAGLIAVVNRLTGGNYMFLSHKPEGASVLDFLGPWPWYLLSLEGVLLATCLVLYSPFAVRNWIRQAENRRGDRRERT
ncbi:MAG: TIGR02206 family membrane protein [Oscillospiraceae bacterium]|nr:TIGR02206 family membrane protein [Oscillospiraceae bacterium]